MVPRTIESGRDRQPLSADERSVALRRLTEVDGSSGSSAAPIRATSGSRSRGPTCWSRCSTPRSRWAAQAGAREVVIAMAHRGRINVLTHILEQAVRDDLRRVRGEARRRPAPRARRAT